MTGECFMLNAKIFPRAVPPGSPIIESREDVVSEGNKTELTCTAIGSKPVASIRWMKGDEELTGQWKNRDSAVSRRRDGVFSHVCLPVVMAA